MLAASGRKDSMAIGLLRRPIERLPAEVLQHQRRPPLIGVAGDGAHHRGALERPADLLLVLQPLEVLSAVALAEHLEDHRLPVASDGAIDGRPGAGVNGLGDGVPAVFHDPSRTSIRLPSAVDSLTWRGHAAGVTGSAAYVMVVDDDADLRESIAAVLSAAGHTYAMADDGAAALARLRAQGPRPCLVLLDLMMPRMSGFELRTVMKEDPALASIPVVVVTGAGALAQRRAAELDVEILTKPIEVQTLLQVVDRICGKPAAPGET